MTVGGLVLTGGASRRMGCPKALVLVQGERIVDRVVRALAAAGGPVIEVGPGYSGLPAVSEEPAGTGPLAALAAGWAALRAGGHRGPVVVLACDLPLVDAAVVRFLATWPGPGSVVPVVAGRAQPLCARWSGEDLAAAGPLVDSGQRSLRGLLGRPGVALVAEDTWAAAVPARSLADVDSPADLDALGLAWEPPPPRAP